MCTLKKNLHKDLISVFGIGQARKLFVLKSLGLPLNTNTIKKRKISDHVFEKVMPIVERFKVGHILFLELKSLFDLARSTYGFKYLRFIMCLPCNGQRTKTNACTARKRRKTDTVVQKAVKLDSRRKNKPQRRVRFME